MFRLESRSSNFTPANLNPRHSGSTLAKILEGKYPSVEIEAKAKVPANRIVSKKIAAEKEKDLDRVYNNVLREDSDDVSKETVKKGIGTLQRNPISGIGTRGSDDVGKETVKKGISTLQRNPSSGIGTHRKVDLPFPLPPSQETSRPLVPNPYENTSWLATEIEKLLNKKSRMANSKFKFEVNPEAASSNFNKLAKNDFNLEELLNPAERCMTSYRSELKE